MAAVCELRVFLEVASRALSRVGCYSFRSRDTKKDDVEVRGCCKLSGAEQVL